MKRANIFALLALGVSGAVFCAYAYLIYDFASYGTGWLFGAIIPPAVICAVVTSVPFRKIPYRVKIATSILVGTAVMATTEFQGARIGLDLNLARPVISSSKSLSEFFGEAKKHPNNSVLQAISTVWGNSLTTANELAQLVSNADIKETLLLEPIYTYPIDQIHSISESLRAASQNLTKVADQVPGIYEAEYNLSRKGLEALEGSEFCRQLFKGLQERHDWEKELFVRSIQANIALYRSIAYQGDFFISQGGKYDSATGSVVFSNQAKVDAWNTLVSKSLDASEVVHAIEVEVGKFEQRRAVDFNSIKPF